MSNVYLFSNVYVFLYLLNYITSLYCKLSDNYKHGCRNDQPICKNKGRNESNELSSNNWRFFQNNLGLVFHTTYSCIFHPCDLLLLFPLPHFQSPRLTHCGLPPVWDRLVCRRSDCQLLAAEHLPSLPRTSGEQTSDVISVDSRFTFRRLLKRFCFNNHID